MNSMYEQAMDLDARAGSDATESRSAVRSCTTCAKAKAKCVKRPDQSICERCARLNKDCQFREPVARRRKVTKATRAAQLEKLEGKIEHLVNALSKSQAQRSFDNADHGQPSPPASSISERSDSLQRAVRSDIIDAMCGDDCGQPSNTPPTTASTTPHADLPQPRSDYPSNLGVSLGGAEILLDRYRRVMAHANPFVVVPSDVTAETLNKTKPFLLHAIVTVAFFHDLPRQQKMVKQMMRDISERILINSEKSLDILQGIIVFVSWYHPHVFWAQQVSNILHLAIAVTCELGIDRSPNACIELRPATAKGVPPRTFSLEEHRTLAGVYYLTGMLASSFRKMDSMPHTKHLEESMNILEQAAEFESDMIVVQTVRLQSLIQQTNMLEAGAAPSQLYIKGFAAELDRLRKTNPSTNSDNVFLKMQDLTAEVLTYELALTDLQENKAKPTRAHLDSMYRCMESIKAFIAAYFTIPSSVYLTVPFPTFGQFAHVFIAMIKLASLEVEEWDMQDLKQKLDFVGVVDETCARFDASTKSSPDGLTVNNESFGKWAHRLRWMKSVYEARFTAATGDERGITTDTASTLKPTGQSAYPQSEQTNVQNFSQQQQATPPDDVLSGDFFNYLDEGWWQSFGADFDMGFADMSMNVMGVSSSMSMGHGL